MAYDRNEMRIVSPARHDRLKRWSERKPCVALMGEFSAGKSTLLNFLIGEDLLPTKAIATELPPVWFTYGRGDCHWIDEAGNRHEMDIADLARVPIEARYARIYTNSELLEHCDVIDTPGISDPNLARDSWRMAASQSNLVLWCTTATQAWRETERGAWLSLPERLQKHSLLVVTRADKLTLQADRDKVARRLNRETAGLFSGTVFMSTPEAVRARAELGDAETSPLWEASGAANLLGRLGERFQAVYAERATMFERYVVEGSDAARLASAKAAGQAGLMPTRPVRPAGERPRRAERPSPEDVDDWLQRASDAMEATGPAPGAFPPLVRDTLMARPDARPADAAAPEPEAADEPMVEDLSSAMEIVEDTGPEADAPVTAGVTAPPAFEIEVEDAEILDAAPPSRGAEVIRFGAPLRSDLQDGAGAGGEDLPKEIGIEVSAEAGAASMVEPEPEAADDEDDMMHAFEAEAEEPAETTAEADAEAETADLAAPAMTDDMEDSLEDEAPDVAIEAAEDAPEPAGDLLAAAAADDLADGEDAAELSEADLVEAELDLALADEALLAAQDEVEADAPAELAASAPEPPEAGLPAIEGGAADDLRRSTAPYVLRARDRAEPAGEPARPVAVWREIAARYPAAPTGADVVAMIDAFLVELYQGEEPGAEAALLAAAAAGLEASPEESAGADEAAAHEGFAAASGWDDDLDGIEDDDDAPGPHDGAPGSGWRRLA